MYKCLKSLSQEPGWPVVFLLLETGHASGGRPWLLRYNRGRMRRKNTRLASIASSAFLLVCLVPGARALDAIVLEVRELSVAGVPIEGASARLELLSDQTTRMTLAARERHPARPHWQDHQHRACVRCPGDCRAALRLRYRDAHGRGRACWPHRHAGRGGNAHRHGRHLFQGQRTQSGGHHRESRWPARRQGLAGEGPDRDDHGRRAAQVRRAVVPAAG